MPTLCVSCEDTPATTTCGSPSHECLICDACRRTLVGTQTPAEGARTTAAKEPGGSESAPTPHIVPSAGTT